MVRTRLIATPEAFAYPVYKQRILDANEDQTVRTTLFGFGWPDAPHRTLRTPFVEPWLPKKKRGSEQRPMSPPLAWGSVCHSCASWAFHQLPTAPGTRFHGLLQRASDLRDRETEAAGLAVRADLEKCGEYPHRRTRSARLQAG